MSVRCWRTAYRFPWQSRLPVKSRPVHHSSWSSSASSSPKRPTWHIYSVAFAATVGAGCVAYQTWDPFRYTVVAAKRCSILGKAVVLDAIDYKRTLGRTYTTPEEEQKSLSECHLRSARRILLALLANGGIFVKLGQHISSLAVLPIEWTSTMRPLQDQCHATPYDDIETMFKSDTGKSIPDWFDDFQPDPIGVASLAQVHLARDRESGQRVAVKLQHPYLVDFCDIDMAMVEFSLAWVKKLFPEFEFTWLGEEMRENLPKELNFVHEASNAAHLVSDFQDIKTSLYVPRVLFASRRILVMEFIDGGRVDDKEYLANHNIDRNKVALELSRIFSQMVHLNGWFHADPHLGNLLIRRSPIGTTSPYNFEIVMLDHGLHFDIDDNLRLNYSKLWLSLISPTTAKTIEERRKYAEIVGNIGPELYPVFQTAITGRIGLDDVGTDAGMPRPASMIDMLPQTSAELEMIRQAVLQREGMLQSVFDVLRRVPRRVLMLLKLNDLTRSLDHALATTHSNVRVFLITARYCSLAVWRDERQRLLTRLGEEGLFSPGILYEYFRRWWAFQYQYQGLHFVELYMDIEARLVLTTAWVKGLLRRGFKGAQRAAAGLDLDPM
ncbi:ABC1 family-domain-containing protein [Hysterangium stoloniferum]|nr:ABC1 family-domain-containing protein [Hysterangium stoloniferum]